MEYNMSQVSAIQHKDGPMLVLAGPGSGKTAVITQRTVNLIEEHGINPSNILVITFTKAAANEMKQRFARAVKQEHVRVTFGTFHAIFFMVLKYAYHFESSNIVTEEQRYQLMREILSYHHLEYKDENEFIGDLLGEISQIKNARIDVAHYYSSHCGEEVFRKIYEAYNRRLAQSRLIDFDDMLTYTYDLFVQRPDILAAWQNKYQYILIDEFQDINQIQYDIIRMMAAPRNNLFIVGDDDQSIYRFRGSRPEIMLGFEKDYPDACRVALDVNYRCAPQIVAAAGKLVAHNEHRFPKEIRAARDVCAQISFTCFDDQRKENAYVIEQIRSAVAAGVSPQEIAVLCRTNTQPGLLLEQMMEQGISFRTRERIPNIYEHWIAKDFFTYIRIAQGSTKRADFLSIMNKPKRYIGRDSLCEPEVAFDEWIKMYDERPWVAERIEQLWHDVKMLRTMGPYAAVNYIRRGIGYDDYIAEYADYRNISKEDLYDVAEEILSSARGYRTMEEWLDHISAYQRRLGEMAKRAYQSPDAVTVSTLHSAKGLEYRQVFLVDVNEGVMPYKKAVLETDIEEERRLFYVGMTRAKDALFICSTKSVNNKTMEVSRFIKEAGA